MPLLLQNTHVATVRRRQHPIIKASSAAGEIKLYYRTKWGSAKVHGSVQGAAWQDFQLQKVNAMPYTLAVRYNYLVGDLDAPGNAGVVQSHSIAAASLQPGTPHLS